MTTTLSLAHATRPTPAARAEASTPVSARHRPTTFSCLTGIAADLLEQALVQAGPGEEDSGWLAEAHAAHRDLTHALAHLGSTLLGLGSVSTLAAARPSGPADSDRRLVMLLARRAVLHDWEQPPAEVGTTADRLAQAARALRAAADLWATHHTQVGEARSPEASRMRHPAMLGAAVREWRGLVVMARAMADQLSHHSRASGRRAPLYRDLIGYPVPRDGGPTSEARVIDLTVARPARRRSSDPLIEIEERTTQLRALAWRMSQAGMAPVDLLANAAAIAVVLANAAERTSRSAARLDPDAAPAHLLAADRAAAQGRAWRAVGPLLHDLRSPLRPSPALVTERRDLETLVERAAAATGTTSRADEVADVLVRASDRFADVAAYLALALRRARGRRAVLLSGRALTHTMLGKKDKLLTAKVRDQVVVAPDRIVVSIEQALRAAAETGPQDLERALG